VENKYQMASRNIIAKALEELYFEEIFSFNKIGSSMYSLQLNNGISYHFKGKKTILDSILVEASTIERYIHQDQNSNLNAATFFIETQYLTKMSDETLSIFIEELEQTLFSDIILLDRSRQFTLEQLAEFNFLDLNKILQGHPKLLLNKGRIGWGKDDISKYSPECAGEFQLFYIAAKKSILTIGTDPTLSQEEILLNNLTDQEIEFIKKKLSLDEYSIIPLHPWQWSNKVAIQYGQYINSGEIIVLGELGSKFGAQASIRTLSNLTSPQNLDIKTSLTILNTSSFRGIPSKTIPFGHQLSDRISDILNSDDIFKNNNTICLKEISGISLKHPHYEDIEFSPYRYREMLGCVWRESADSKISSKQQAIPTAALFHSVDGNYLIREYIKRSGIDQTAWLKSYINKVIIPLYHLQLKYGIGLVAHGQNTILILTNSIPTGLIIKDFHGDLRITSDSCLCEYDFSKYIDKLPDNYLIHDLFTGHFITVFRYLVQALTSSFDITDKEILTVLKDELTEYTNNNPISKKYLDLTSHKFEKVLVNKVRFIMGYGETQERLKPVLGKRHLTLNPEELYE